MKKYILSIFAIVSIFLLSGCGGGGSTSTISSDGTVAQQKEAELSNPELIITDTLGIDFSLKLHVQKNLNGNYKVALDNLNLEVDGCPIVASSLVFSPTSIVLDGNAASSKDIDVRGKFVTSCTNLKTYTLKGNQTVTLNGLDEKSLFISSSEDSGTGSGTPPPGTGYTFYNADTPLVISQANTPYEIKAQLLKDGFIAANQTVQLVPFSSIYGDVENYSVSTGSDGYAKFTYTSPTVLPANGTSSTVTMVYKDENNASYSQNVVLTFNTSGGSTTSQYSLVNVSTPLEITAGNQEKNITVYVVDSTTNVGVSGKDVTITTIENGYGSVSSSTATTDASGKALFSYTAPSNITGLTTTTVKLRLTDNGVTSEKQITLNFTPPSGGGTQYSLINATNIIVTSPNSTKEISVDLIDTVTGVGVSGKNISITTISNVYGAITPSIVTTNDSGKAIFTYTAPTTLINGNTVATLHFVDDTGTTITKDITIVTIPPAGGGAQYSFVNETNLTVTAANTSYVLSVDLIDSATGVGVSKETVSLTTIPNSFGSISPATTTTDDAGRATFTYISPVELTIGTTEATFIYTDVNGNTIQKNVSINITPSAGGSSSTIDVLPLDSNISTGAEAKPINVYVKDSTGRPAANASVVVEYFNAKYGVMNTYEDITDANGHIEFIYRAPDDIESLDGQTFTFAIALKLDANVTQNVQIGFHKSVVISPVANIYIAPNDVTIVRAGEVRTIKVTTVDSRNYAVSTDLRIENPTQNGQDYGSFDVSDFTTDILGNKIITYTAPASLDGLAERNITIVELSTNLEKTLTLHFQQPASTETSYDLNLSVDQSIKVDGSGTLGIVIHETGKPNDLIAQVDVKNVTATMKFPKMLLFENNLTSITYANENINSYTLFAQHLSGVAVVEVVATVFNGVRDITLREEFPVVITSGPVSSMSMFHSLFSVLLVGSS